jgi:O-antigen ligase
LLCEVGVVGLLSFVCAMLFYVVLLIKIIGRSEKYLELRKYSVAALAALIFYLVTCLTDNSFDYVLQLGLYVFSFIGLSFNLYKLVLNADNHQNFLS